MTKKQNKGPFFYKKVYNIPIYGGYFIIIFSNDREKISQAVNCCEYALGNLYAYTFHNFSYKGKEAYCVVFNFWNIEGEVTMGTITHEITHAGNRLLHARGITPDWENDEPEAYVKGWMSDCVQDFMGKCGLI